MVSRARFQEIVEDAFQPHNSTFKRRERQMREEQLQRQQEEPLQPDKWYSSNDPRILAHQANQSKEQEGINLEQSKRIRQMVGAEWNFKDETLEEYKKRTYDT